MDLMALQVQQPKFDSPVESQSKVLQLRQLLQADQMGQMQQQQAQTVMQDDASYRTAIQNNPQGGDALRADLARAGNYKGVATSTKADLDARKTEAGIASSTATASKTQFDLIKEANSMIGSAAGWLKTNPTPENAARVLSDLKQKLGPELAHHFQLDAVQIPTDPDAIASWANEHHLAAIDADKQYTDARIKSEGDANRAAQVINSKYNRDTQLMVQDKINTRQGTGGGSGGLALTHGIKGLSEAQNAALSESINAGLLNPNKVNGKTASLYADLILKNPKTDFNKLGADATLLNNPGFQQKAMTAETLPEVMDNMVKAGKKVGFSDNKTIGKMQAWIKGEFNDPDMTAYMVQRNDALMGIASVMRGNGMTDMAHKAEMEASSPTMSPSALDAWLRAQNVSLQPRLRRNARIMHTAVPGAPLVVPDAGGGSPAPAAASGGRPSLDAFFTKK